MFGTRRRTAATAAMLALSMVSSPAAADATLTVATVGAEARAEGEDERACEQLLTTSQTCSASNTMVGDGPKGSGSGSVDATLGFDDLNFLVSIIAQGRTSAQATATEDEDAYGGGDAGVDVSFDVERRVKVSVKGTLTATTSGGRPCSHVLILRQSGVAELDVRAPGSDCGPGGRAGGPAPDPQNHVDSPDWIAAPRHPPLAARRSSWRAHVADWRTFR